MMEQRSKSAGDGYNRAKVVFGRVKNTRPKARNMNFGSPDRQWRTKAEAEVAAAGVSNLESKVWRKGPASPLRIGSRGWMLRFDEWPLASVSECRIKSIDLLDRLYVVEIEGKLWTVAQERMFANPYDAERERQIHNIFNTACYECKESDMLPGPLHHVRNRDRKPIRV